MRLVVAIPTWNNPEQLKNALASLARTDIQDYGEVRVVDNGGSNQNLGWCGGINKALREAPPSDLFCMCNDDVVFPPGDFWRKLIRWFDSARIGGVGPISNYVAGLQHASLAQLPPAHTTNLLIGFCALYRRELLKDGLDEALPGGDDLDLSIRVRKTHVLAVDRTAFLYHLGAQTGRRVHPNYWDSRDHQHKTMNAIIRKHGFRRWYDCVNPTGETSELLLQH